MNRTMKRETEKREKSTYISSTYLEATMIVVMRSLCTFLALILNPGLFWQNRSIQTQATTYTEGPALVYLKILSRQDSMVISGISLQSKMFVLMTLDKALEQFFTILCVLAMLLSMSEARTFITNGVLESSLYEQEQRSQRSFLGDIVRVEEEAMRELCFERD